MRRIYPVLSDLEDVYRRATNTSAASTLPAPHSKAFRRSFFPDPALGRSEFPFDRKACFRNLQSAFSPWPPDVSPSPSLIRRSLPSATRSRTSVSVVPDLLRSVQFYQRRASYIVTSAVFCPSFSKYHRFPIIAAGRKQLWRVLITYSISQQPA